ncbi:MAG: hypothetical protein WC294_00695 [Methanoregula sp.]|jgi:hypothetical protein
MTSDVQIPVFPCEVIDSLPLYYRAMILHLTNTGRVVIEDPSEPKGRD